MTQQSVLVERMQYPLLIADQIYISAFEKILILSFSYLTLKPKTNHACLEQDYVELNCIIEAIVNCIIESDEKILSDSRFRN